VAEQKIQVTLIIFTSEGREHLLKESLPSFLYYNTFPFGKTILAIDGNYDRGALATANPDLVLQQYKRKGYIASIWNALNGIETPYFFWLEDDFIFNYTPPLERMLGVMEEGGWAGIFLSRSAPLVDKQKKKQYAEDLFLMEIGYSVSPALCNTQIMRAAFEALAESPKDESTRRLGFETFIDNYFIQNGYKYAVIDPGNTAPVKHIGDLESTPREYHMVNSTDEKLSDIDKFYLSGFGKEGQLTLYNKIAMLPKLWYAAIILTFKLFTNRRAYDFAFRIYVALLRGFKY
jgi:hypothetical protein